MTESQQGKVNMEKWIEETVENLMQTLEHSTKEKEISMQVPPEFNLNFETFEDSGLIKMKKYSEE